MADKSGQDGPQHPAASTLDPAVVSRVLMRSALKGSIATLDRSSGHPYASLVLVATEPDGSPVFLISRLALHTRNLEQDPRCSLLIDGTDGLGNPLAGGRLTLIGKAHKSANPAVRTRFLARHPSAQDYAEFADFAFYTLAVEGGHFIGGFGRIVDLAARELTSDVRDAGALVAAEPDIVSHMNEDHADAVALYATVLAGKAEGAWRMSGIDPEGADLLHCTSAARIVFPTRVLTPGQAREALVALVGEARARQSSA
jgi:hypothetical protein